MNHLAVYNSKVYGDDYIALMLSGIKTIDSKFSYRRTTPYQRLAEGDVIYLKESSGPVRGRVTVKSVIHHELSGPEEVMEFLAPYYKQLGIKDEAHLNQVWDRNKGKHYVCQWRIVGPEALNTPVRIFKNDMRSWVDNYQVPEEVQAAFLDQ